MRPSQRAFCSGCRRPRSGRRRGRWRETRWRPEVDPGHLLRHPEQVPAPPPAPDLSAGTAVQAQLRPEHLPHQLHGELVVLVELQPPRLTKTPLAHRPERLEDHLQGLVVKSGPRALRHSFPPDPIRSRNARILPDRAEAARYRARRLGADRIGTGIGGPTPPRARRPAPARCGSGPPPRAGQRRLRTAAAVSRVIPPEASVIARPPPWPPPPQVVEGHVVEQHASTRAPSPPAAARGVDLELDLTM